MTRIFMIAVMVFAASSASAQELEASKIPSEIQKSFEKKYPGTVAKWEKEDGNYEANFKQATNNMSVLIDAKGIILLTEIDIKISDFPQPIVANLKKNYKDKTIKEASRIIKADGSLNYEAEIDDVDVLFDDKGNFLEEKKIAKKKEDEKK